MIYTVQSLEFGKVCQDLFWNHCTSTPHRSETNGFAETAVRRVKEGTSAILLQLGVGETSLADSMYCPYYLRNVQHLLSDRKLLTNGDLDFNSVGQLISSDFCTRPGIFIGVCVVCWASGKKTFVRGRAGDTK